MSLILAPSNLDELKRVLADANTHGQKVATVKLAAFQRVLEHKSEDMTVTVEAGITLAALQARLARCGQWLPVDPPQPERLTIEQLLVNNESGPHRFGYGTIREHLIGIKVVLADGRVIKAGGKVVKNVAGYDLCKLFVGSRGTLGVVFEATFKLRPLPEVERFVQIRCDTLGKAGVFLETVLESVLTPVVLDSHRILPAGSTPAFTVVLGFAGMREDVEWQLLKARELGASEPSNLDYEKSFWNGENAAATYHLSVSPSHLMEALQALGEVPFVSRAGNGIIWYRGEKEPLKNELPTMLTRRIKDAYDPKGVFPALSM